MKRLVLVALLGFLTAGITAHAQMRATTIGPKAGLYFDGSHPMLGVNFDYPLTPDLDIEPGAELEFGILNTTLLDIDLNGRYSFNVPGSDVRPYALAGLAAVYTSVTTGGETSSNVSWRVNLGGGAVFNSRDLVQFWAGLKIYLADPGTDIGLMGGVNFAL